MSERKRTAINMEMASAPIIMYMMLYDIIGVSGGSVRAHGPDRPVFLFPPPKVLQCERRDPRLERKLSHVREAVDIEKHMLVICRDNLVEDTEEGDSKEGND